METWVAHDRAPPPRLTCDELAPTLVQVRGDHVPHGVSRCAQPARKDGWMDGEADGDSRLEAQRRRRRRRRARPAAAQLHGKAKEEGEQGGARQPSPRARLPGHAFPCPSRFATLPPLCQRSSARLGSPLGAPPPPHQPGRRKRDGKEREGGPGAAFASSGEVGEA